MIRALLLLAALGTAAGAQQPLVRGAAPVGVPRPNAAVADLPVPGRMTVAEAALPAPTTPWPITVVGHGAVKLKSFRCRSDAAMGSRTCAVEWNAYRSAEMTAEPGEGMAFVGWANGCGSGLPKCQQLGFPTKPVPVAAVFAPSVATAPVALTVVMPVQPYVPLVVRSVPALNFSCTPEGKQQQRCAAQVPSNYMVDLSVGIDLGGSFKTQTPPSAGGLLTGSPPPEPPTVSLSLLNRVSPERMGGDCAGRVTEYGSCLLDMSAARTVTIAP